MRRRPVHLFHGFVALAVLGAIVIGPPARGATGPRFALADATGALSLTNSRAGSAVFNGSGLRPGDPVSGTVVIGNPASARAGIALEAGAEGDGGALWPALELTVTDVSVANAPVVLYDGAVANLGRLALGPLDGGAQHTYRLTAILPAASGNALQGAHLSLRFTWLAQALDAAPSGGGAPAATPTAPPTPAAAAPAATAVAGAPAARTVSADQLFTLPDARACVSRRRLTVHVHAPGGVHVKATTVTVNGRRLAATKGAKAAVTLRGLPQGTFKVQVTATLTNGRKVVLRRTYRTCAPRKR